MTTTPKPPKTPAGLAARGKRIWRSVVDEFLLSEQELALLLELARTADVLDRLAKTVAVEGDSIDGKPHWALIESRQLRITFARISAALRLPEEDDGVDGRAQRRVGVRTPYELKSVAG